MNPNRNLKQSLIASLFLFINYAAISASIPSSGNPSETRFFGRRLSKDPHSAPDIAVSGTTKLKARFAVVVSGTTKQNAEFAVAISGTRKPNPELKKICDKTDYPSLCLSTLTPFFNGKTDAISLLQMAIDAATKETKAAISAAQKMVNAPSTPPETASILKDCIETYNDALENFQSAEDAISEKDKGTIDSMLSAAIADYETCNDEFDGSNPMAKYGEKLENMTDNCLVFASFIK